MLVAPHAKNPEVLTYLTLRKAVGIVALGLPFALAIPYWLISDKLEPSISDYYYTGMRNLFEGSLCAIAMFMLCTTGYDRKDEVAGVFSAVCGIGVAFFPTTPDCATSFQRRIGTLHYIFAALLFSTLAYFCLVLFKMTAVGRSLTRQKVQRNRVYTACGIAIIASMLSLVLFKMILHVDHLAKLGTVFCFESTSLFAFGFAWLTKGETFLKDKHPEGERENRTDPTGQK